MEITSGHFLVAIAWSALWAQITVVPFLRDSLHKEHSEKRDLALSNIEAKKMEAVAELIEEANQAKQEKAARGLTVEYTALLLEAKYQPILNRVQEAEDESRKIKRCWEAVTHTTSRLWQACLVHAVSLVAIVGVAALVKEERIRDMLIAGLAVVAVGSFIVMIWKFFGRDSNQNRLLHLLDKNGGKTSTDK